MRDYVMVSDPTRQIASKLSSLLCDVHPLPAHRVEGLTQEILAYWQRYTENLPHEDGWTYVAKVGQDGEEEDVLFAVFMRTGLLLALERLPCEYTDELATIGYYHLETNPRPRFPITLLADILCIGVPICGLLGAVDGYLSTRLRTMGLVPPPFWAGRVYRVVYPSTPGVHAVVAYTIDASHHARLAWLCTYYRTWRCWGPVPPEQQEESLAQFYRLPQELVRRIIRGELSHKEFEAEMTLVQLARE